ncbi:S1C family serine protease [Candidatus Latescibacterota bacterium]
MNINVKIPLFIVFTLIKSFYPNVVIGETNPDNISISHAIIEKYGGNMFTVIALTAVRTIDGENERNERWRQNIGTAFSVDNEGHLITFNTVIKDAENVSIISNSGKKTNAQVLGCDKSGQINVLKIDGYNDFSTVNVTHCKQMNIGDEVILLGINGTNLTTTSGIINEIRNHDCTLIVSLDDNPGTSGTPVFSKKNHLIGYLVYQVENYNSTDSNQAGTQKGLYLVVTSQFACTAARLIINKTEGKSGWLGITSSISSIDNPENDGVIIQNIIKNSPAEKSGLIINDKIIMFNNVKITSFTELIEVLTDTRIGDTVPVRYIRGGKTLSSNVTLSAFPENQ